MSLLTGRDNADNFTRIPRRAIFRHQTFKRGSGTNEKYRSALQMFDKSEKERKMHLWNTLAELN